MLFVFVLSFLAKQIGGNCFDVVGFASLTQFFYLDLKPGRMKGLTMLLFIIESWFRRFSILLALWLFNGSWISLVLGLLAVFKHGLIAIKLGGVSSTDRFLLSNFPHSFVKT